MRRAGILVAVAVVALAGCEVINGASEPELAVVDSGLDDSAETDSASDSSTDSVQQEDGNDVGGDDAAADTTVDSFIPDSTVDGDMGDATPDAEADSSDVTLDSGADTHDATIDATPDAAIDSATDTHEAATDSAADTHDATPMCEVGVVTCVGNERRACVDGAISTIETCATAKLCDPAGCKPPTCAVAEHRCVSIGSQVLQVCNADRTGWDDQKTCAAACTAAGCVDVGSASVSEVNTCVQMVDGSAYCWGHNVDGSLGFGSYSDSLIPVQVSGLTNVKAIVTGGDHACTVLADGTVKCFGNDQYGQLGDNSSSSTKSPVPVTVAGLSGVKSIALGPKFSCALGTDGSVRCWGFNGDGQLGDGTNNDSKVPKVVSGLGSGVASLSCGLFHCCAVVASNVKCWGRNDSNQIGDGTTSARNVPTSTTVTFSNAVSVRASVMSTCVQLADTTTRCWGYNADAGLSGDYTAFPTPADTTKLTGVLDISIGEFWGCGVLSGGKGYCWGSLLPAGSALKKPASFGGISSGATSVSSGNQNTCFVIAGTVKCFGTNVEGEIGDGSVMERDLPVVPKW